MLAREKLHDAMFDLKYEAMLKEKGLNPKEPLDKLPLSAFKPKQAADHLKLKIKLMQEEVPKPPVP